jgi:hypothetical protein
VLILGEVRTCLVQNSSPLSSARAADLLSIKAGRPVLVTDRPINRTVSPDTLMGVDCRLSTVPKVKARGIGTVSVRATLSGGLVLQSSARARLEAAQSQSRHKWSHYTRRRGVVEVISKASFEHLAQGHRTRTESDTLDLGAVSQHLIGLVQQRPQLDHAVALRTRPTRLRWSAQADDSAEPTVHLHVDDEVLRTVRVVVPADRLDLAERFCEDLALHDWLLTTVGNVVEQADRVTAAGDDPLPLLTSALGLLVKLWMPAAHVDPRIRALWDLIETQPGFTRQWQAQITWIRDQMAVRTIKALERLPGHEVLR